MHLKLSEVKIVLPGAVLSAVWFACSTMYWDDRYGTETVSHEVLGRMKQLMVDNNTAASHSFLLDDDSSIPFSLDDISNLMEDKVSQDFSCSLKTQHSVCSYSEAYQNFHDFSFAIEL